MGNDRLTSERLFTRFFAPLYPPEALLDLASVRATDANPAGNPGLLAQLDAIAETFARLAPTAFAGEPLDLDFSDASVHRLGARLTREQRDGWLAEEPPAGEPPRLVTVVTHGALYVGACIVRRHGGAWQVRSPLWESQVRLSSAAGTGDLAPFHWWLKSLSDDEVDRQPLADRYRTHVEVPTFDAAALPRLVDGARRLPRLAKVRYDTLHKHLRAHLPELRTVGDDFPSPERLDELGFQWLDFVLLGDGRMLLIHGPTDRGVHLFWLGAEGFVKSAYYAADAFPAHVVQAEGDRLRVIASIQGKPEVHEMLWWGA